ncbi:MULTISPECIES: DUF924 family protein [unclassified Moraxella]|uniref:DUF924 family protein n=1 Tax=unclassified Moraxella TaxID=2685852 RepID=UPI003AF877DE
MTTNNPPTTNTPQPARIILDFWFSDTTKPFWFAKSDDFDRQLTYKFSALLQQASQVELGDWRVTAHGRLAEIIVLDQFSRNIYRDTPQAFAQDGMALVLSQELVKQADFAEMNEVERNFALMPFMHSESVKIHEQAVGLFEQFASKNTLDFELKHKAIIDRFGRYPHRNAILGRESTDEEIEFLKQPNSGF